MSDNVSAIMNLLQAPHIDMEQLAQALDSASSEERVSAIRQFTPSIQKRLFEAAEGRKITINDMVPESIGALTEIIHEGQNTLPAFRAFQKRFTRPSTSNQRDDKPVLWGYNHQLFSGITGPGYYVAYDDIERGEVVIDYRQLPPERVAEWPEIIDNKKKLGRFVYAGMVDRLRRVSNHVTIGRAYKTKPMSAWFVLVRTID